MRSITLTSLLTAFALSPVSVAFQQAFLDRSSAAPGETVHVHVSSPAAYSIEVLHAPRFGQSTLIASSQPLPANVQPTRSGSYAFVPTSPALEITGSISLEAWIRPNYHVPGQFQGILSKYGVPNDTAVMIYLMNNRHLSFYVGSTGAFSTSNRLLTSQPIALKKWTHVVATYDGAVKRIYVDGVLDVAADRSGPIFNTPEPWRVGAYGNAGQADEFFNGAIDSPAVYDRVLSPAEVQLRFLEKASYSAGGGTLPGAVAQWNFQELEGVTLADATGNGHHLTLVENGTRGLAGPAGGTPAQGSRALRFAEDDRYNPAWSSSYSFTVDPAWPLGFYKVRISGGNVVRLPLVVKPGPDSSKSRIYVLANLNTWVAYNGWSASLYATHSGGNAISYYVGMRQPNPGAHVDLTTFGGGYSHLVDGERYLYHWLAGMDHGFDLYTDLDLHREPDRLLEYDVMILNGHSEYWSHEMVDAVEAFLAAGGNLVNTSGNTMWSLVSYNDDFTIMEGRKHPHSAGTIPPDERAHSTGGGVLGGTLRCIGRPEHEVIGAGYGILYSTFGRYRVRQPGHWVFEGTGVTLGQFFGDSLNGGAILGHEADVLHDLWSPTNAEILAVGQSTSATWLDISDCQTRTVTPVVVGSQMYTFAHPGGGEVFGAPSIAFGGSANADPVTSRVLANVLRRFLSQ